MSDFDAANRYSLHTKVRLLVHTQLTEYCNKSSKDFSGAIRDFIEEGLDRWQKDGQRPTNKDADLLYAVKDAELMRERKRMLRSILPQNPERFQSLCVDYGISPESVYEEIKETPLKKREMCRYFVSGVLSNGRIESSKIRSLCLSMGFSESQMYRTLNEMAHSVQEGTEYYWEK